MIDRTPNTFGKSRTEPNRRFGRTEPSAEIGPIYRTRSAVLAEHSSVGRTIVRQKNSSVRFGRNRVRSITSLYITFTVLMAILVIVSLVLTESVFPIDRLSTPSHLGKTQLLITSLILPHSLGHIRDALR